MPKGAPNPSAPPFVLQGRESNDLAYFYEDRNDQDADWEDVGGFNTHLLSEIRNALLSVDSADKPGGTVNALAADWIKRLPMFDFPDDEIG